VHQLFFSPAGDHKVVSGLSEPPGKDLTEAAGGACDQYYAVLFHYIEFYLFKTGDEKQRVFMTFSQPLAEGMSEYTVVLTLKYSWPATWFKLRLTSGTGNRTINLALLNAAALQGLSVIHLLNILALHFPFARS